MLRVGDREFTIYRLDVVARTYPGVGRLPFTLRVMLENLLRNENGGPVTAEHVGRLAAWQPTAVPADEIAFTPGRVLLQDFTGVPALVDLAAMRDAMRRMGGDPRRVNPLKPVELVIDHSVQVDSAGHAGAFQFNADRELERNRERYQLLRWGDRAFRRLRVVPPGTGIVHQVNLEHLARVVEVDAGARRPVAFPDTVVGTDSHTTMVNALGVLGWGVGGIEAEAGLLGQPISMLVPPVIGVRLTGALGGPATATDLVLTLTQVLRKRHVVGKFVEFFGEGLAQLSLADRATVANMAPEFGATCAFFPIDDETLRYLRLSGRSDAHLRLIEAYAKEQGLFLLPESSPSYSAEVVLDLATVEPCLAGPTRPQDRVPLSAAKTSFREALGGLLARQEKRAAPMELQRLQGEGGAQEGASKSPLAGSPGVVLDDGSLLDHGAIVVAAITSCTNTSNPAAMVAAGLLARNAVQRGLGARPWVKASLAPGSKVVTAYLAAAGLTPFLEQLGFYLVGYGCTTCIGNAGPLARPISEAIARGGLVTAAVLSGNRNFEARIHPEVRANYLASPALVVAYALAGTVDLDPVHEPLGTDACGKPVFLEEIWPSRAEIEAVVAGAVSPEQFHAVYRNLFDGDARWAALGVSRGARYAWDPESTYVRPPPYFDAMSREPVPPAPIRGARVLAMLGDSITTDHISPAGPIRSSSPAGTWLRGVGVAEHDFHSYGARRGNHEVMVRGTFANVRLRNLLVPGTEGGVTRHLPDGALLSIYEASVAYRREGVPLLVIAGRDYGSGSSRDWAAKGPALLGVRAVIARSFERIHRSNLIGMGILPLQFREGEGPSELGLTGEERFDVEVDRVGVGAEVRVRATGPGGAREFRATVRIETPQEVRYYEHGGILPFLLRQLLAVPAPVRPRPRRRTERKRPAALPRAAQTARSAAPRPKDTRR